MFEMFLAAIQQMLGVLQGRLTATRAGLIDNLDAAISTRAAASTALSNATWTAPKAACLDAAVSSRLGSIKLCQRGLITVGAGLGSATATITAVDPAKTILIFLGGGSYDGIPRIELTTTTTITAYLGNLSAGAIGWQIVEFY